MATFSSPEYGKADFVLLDEITEQQFMQNLKLRFQKGKIYSYIGKKNLFIVQVLFCVQKCIHTNLTPGLVAQLDSC